MGGIYAIRNKLNGHMYIGKTKNFKTRWYGHTSKLNRGVSKCKKIQAAWTSYGAENFEFVKIVEGTFSADELKEWELIYIKLYGYYNILLDSDQGFKSSPELIKRAQAAPRSKRHKGWKNYEEVKEFWRNKANGKGKITHPGDRALMKQFNLPYAVARAMILKLRDDHTIQPIEGFNKEEIYQFWITPIHCSHNKWKTRGERAIAKQFGISEKTAKQLIQEFKSNV